jgi:peptide/nickel transport system substrate-binding protein
MRLNNQSSGSYSLAITIVIMVMLAGTLVPGAEAREDVVVANLSPVFNCKGGDPSTQAASPPYANQMVFDSLVDLDTKANFVPAIAESFEISPDWKHIDFFLRDNVKFHDGTILTAEDVKYSLDNYIGRGYRSRFIFRISWKRTVGDIEIVNPKHVRVHMKKADAGFLRRLWWGAGIMPKAYREKIGVKEFAKKPIGTGPFKWVDFKQDRWFTVEAVDKHFLKTPAFKTFRMLYVPEHSTRLAMLKANEADMISLIGVHVPQVKSDPNYKVQWIKYASSSILYFADLVDPNSKTPFHDMRVRQAVDMAIDRKLICEKVLFGSSEPLGDVISPISAGYDPSIKPAPYDPEAAKKLLAEAGYPDGFETAINTTMNNPYVDAVAASLDEIGIKTKINKFEGGAFLQGYTQKKLRGLVPYASWYSAEVSAPADLSDFYGRESAHCFNTTDEIDSIIKKGLYAISHEDLAKAGRELSKAIRDSRITLMLWANNAPYGLSNKIKSWNPAMGAAPAADFDTIVLNK